MPWHDTPLNATLDGPGCIQNHHNPDVPCNGASGPRCQSEDCLNVNVFCKVRDPADGSLMALMPTMIYFHGGAFDEGSNRGPYNMYDGSYLAATGNLCVVAANYRLGVFGALVADGEGTYRIGGYIYARRSALSLSIYIYMSVCV